MRAATIADGQISVQEHPDPEPGQGQILVRVKAAGLNGADMMQLRGFYPAPPGSPPDIPGLELAGEVVGRGPGAERFDEGDRVMAIVGGGFPEVFTTAHDAVFTQAGLAPGERLLVHGGAGGVGTAAIQLGRAAGARVTATVRDSAKRSDVEELGCEAIDPDGFADAGPFDVILELVGAPNLGENLKALETGGRVAVIGISAGAKGELNLGLLMGKRARIMGSTLRARPLEEKALTARRVEKHVLPLVDKALVHVPIAQKSPLDQVAEAYDRFQSGGKLGKIVLVMDG